MEAEEMNIIKHATQLRMSQTIGERCTEREAPNVAT